MKILCKDFDRNCETSITGKWNGGKGIGDIKGIKSSFS